MTVMSVPRFERFLRLAAGLDVDKDDVKRYSDFVGHKLHDLLVVAQANAGANDRDVIEVSDLPITKGLQETIHRFRALDQEVELGPILEQLATLPPLDRPLGERPRQSERAVEARRAAHAPGVRRSTVLQRLRRPRPQTGTPDGSLVSRHGPAVGTPRGVPCRCRPAAQPVTTP